MSESHKPDPEITETAARPPEATDMTSPAEATVDAKQPDESLLTDVETEARIVEEATHRVHWLTMAVALIALLSTGSLGWFGFLEWQRVNANVIALGESQSAVESLTGRITRLDSRIGDLESRAVNAERTAAQSNRDASAVLDRIELLAARLQATQVDTRETYVLAEAEYLLRLADQRLRVERSPANALALQRTADALLAELADPRLQTIREALATDMQLLVGIPELDMLGLQAKLTAMERSLDNLVLPVRRLAPAESTLPSTVQPLVDRISQYITVRRIDAPITPLVTAADAGRARELLRLQLEQLKLALLREESELFAASREAALATLAHYFDVESGAGAAIETGLTDLVDVPIARRIPDANVALVALKEYRQSLLNRQATARALEPTP